MKNIRKTYIKSFALAMTLSAASLAAGDSIKSQYGVKNFDLDLSISFKEQTGSLEKGTLNKTKLMLNSELEMNKFMSFISKLGMKYETGSTQSVFNERRNTPDSSVVYDHAYIRASFFDYIEIGLGSLNNDSEVVGEFIQSNVTSLGTSQKLSYKNEKFEIGAMAIQSKPLNDELSSRIESVEEGSPKFFYEKIYTNFNLWNVQYKLSYGQYAYDQLSSDVAFLERYMGNSITGTTTENSNFDYKYKGKQFRASATFKISPYISLTPSYEFVKNDSALSNVNKAKVQGLNIATTILDTELEIELANYSNERDVTPTFYTRTKYTANNEGKSAKINVIYNGFETGFGYLNRKEIVDLSFSDDEKVYFLEIRKTYDFI